MSSFIAPCEWWRVGIYVTDVMDKACACLKSVLPIGVDKVHRASNWVLILYQTCTTIGMNGKQEIKIVYVHVTLVRSIREL